LTRRTDRGIGHGDDNIRLQLSEFSRKLRQSLCQAFSVSSIDDQILAFYEAVSL